MAEDVRLGLDASDVLSQLSKLAESFKKMGDAARDARKALRGFAKGGTDLGNSISGVSDTVSKASDTMRNKLSQVGGSFKDAGASAKPLEDAGRKISSSLKSAGASATAASGQIQASLSRTAGAAKRAQVAFAGFSTAVGSAFNRLTGIIKVQFVFRAVSGIIRVFKEAIGGAIKFERQVAEILTISDRFNRSLDATAARLIILSNLFARPVEEVAEGFYQVLSNQIGTATQSLNVLNSALSLGRAAVSSTEDAVGLLTSAINAFGFAAGRSDEIAGKIFKTVELGRLRVSDLGNTFGRVASLAATLGVSLDETLASLAALTRQGIKANEAITLINNVMLKLIKPTTELKEVFDELGIASGEIGIQLFGLQGFLKEIARVGGESATELGKLFSRIRAVRGAIGLTVTQAEEFADALERIRDAGKETLREAEALILETNAEEIRRQVTELRNEFLKLGRAALPIINNVVTSLGGLVSILKAVGLAAAAFAGFKFGLLLLANPIAATALALGGLAVAMVAFGNSGERAANRVKARVMEVEEAARKAGAEIRRIAVQTANEQIREVDRVTRALLEQTRTFIANFQEQAEAAEQTFDILKSTLKEIAGTRIGALETVVKKIGNRQADFNRELAKSKKFLEEISDLGNTQLKGVQAIDNATQRANQANILARSQIVDAQKAVKRGDIERARNLLRSAKVAAELSLEAGREADNIDLIRRGRASLIILAQRAAGIEKDNNRLLKSQNKELGQAGERLNDVLRRAKVLQAELLGIELDFETGKVIDPNEAERRFKVVINKIKELFKDVQPKDLALVEKALPTGRDLVAQVRAFRRRISGEKVDLNLVVDKAISKIKDQLAASEFSIAIATDPELRKRLQAAFPDFKVDEVFFTPAAVQQLFFDMGKAAKQGFEQGIDVSDLQGELATIAERLPDVADAALKALTPTFSEATSFAKDLFNNTQGIRTNFSQQQRILDANGKLLAQQVASAKELLAVQKPTVTTLFEISEALRRARISQEVITAAAAQQGRPQAAEATGELVKLLELAEQKITSIVDKQRRGPLGIGAADAPKTLDVLKQINDSFSGIKKGVTGVSEEIPTIPTAAAQAATQLKPETDKMVANWNSVEAAIRSAAQAQALVGGPIAGSARGGPVLRFGKGGRVPKFFQGGGFVPRGTDTVPAMLTPGEFVVNARSARKFFTELVAMNAGMKPTFRQEGGPVTNVQIGDIVVNEAQTPLATARAVGNEMRREFRRGTLSFDERAPVRVSSTKGRSIGGRLR